ncbi:MAG: hypothetical protein HC912_08600, partial [Saprospiraceae bacterium]|nr:hypothetical protein [Saprospiraceae bacterium]
MANYEVEMKRYFTFCKSAFCQNFLYTEISEAQFLAKYMPLKKVLNSEFVLIAEHEGNMVGLMLALHDFYCKHEKRLDCKTIARNSSMQYVGVAHELTSRMIKIAKEQQH